MELKLELKLLVTLHRQKQKNLDQSTFLIPKPRLNRVCPLVDKFSEMIQSQSLLDISPTPLFTWVILAPAEINVASTGHITAGPGGRLKQEASLLTGSRTRAGLPHYIHVHTYMLWQTGSFKN